MNLVDHKLIFNVLKANKKQVFLTALVMTLHASVLLLTPWPAKEALDLIASLSTEHHQTLLLTWVLVLLGLGLLILCLEISEELFTAKLIRLSTTQVRRQLFSDLLHKKLQALENFRRADLLGRISGDVQNLEVYFSSGMKVAFRALPMILFSVLVLFYIHFTFALSLVLFLGLASFAAGYFNRKQQSAEKLYRRHVIKMEQELLQTLSALPLVKSLRAEKSAINALLTQQTQLNAVHFWTRVFWALLNVSFSSTRHFIRAGLLLFGGFAVWKGELSLGLLFAFGSYVEYLAQPISELSSFLAKSSKAKASLERILNLHEELLSQNETSGILPLEKKTLSPYFSFKNVSYTYPGQVGCVFTNANFEIEKGELIAVVGPSGAGKSTLFKLLNRLIDPSSGEVLLQQKSLEQYKLADVRDHQGLFLQDSYLIPGTVRENLTLGLENHPSDDELFKALEKSQAVQFVKDTPLQLETKIGESGLSLSGGQTKRLCLARAFLRLEKTEFFIFDEPTSGLDPVTSLKVMQSIAGLVEKNKTVLFSTHRISEVYLADKVLFISKGQDPLLASHQELLQLRPDYKQISHELLSHESEGQL